MRKNVRPNPESNVESVTSIFALLPTIPKGKRGGPAGGSMRALGLRDWRRVGQAAPLQSPYMGAGEADKNERPKPESHVESITSTFAAHPTIPKTRAADAQPEPIDKNQRPKPECHVESATSTFPLRPTITKNTPASEGAEAHQGRNRRPETSGPPPLPWPRSLHGRSKRAAYRLHT